MKINVSNLKYPNDSIYMPYTLHSSGLYQKSYLAFKESSLLLRMSSYYRPLETWQTSCIPLRISGITVAWTDVGFFIPTTLHWFTNQSFSPRSEKDLETPRLFFDSFISQMTLALIPDVSPQNDTRSNTGCYSSTICCQKQNFRQRRFSKYDSSVK